MVSQSSWVKHLRKHRKVSGVHTETGPSPKTSCMVEYLPPSSADQQYHLKGIFLGNNMYRISLFSIRYCSWKRIFQIQRIVQKLYFEKQRSDGTSAARMLFWNSWTLRNSIHAIVVSDMKVRERHWTTVTILVFDQITDVLLRHKRHY